MMEPILFEQFEQHAEITLNRPEALNALNQEMLNALKPIIQTLSQCQKTKCLVIKANGKHFMAGGDVKMFATLTMPGHVRKETLKPSMHDLHECMEKLAQLPMPIIASVQGAVAGFGLGLMMASDIVIASDRAYFNMAYIKIGLCPDGLVTYWLPRKIGLSQAMAVALTGKRIGAIEAKEIGLINQVVLHDELNSATETMVNTLNANSMLSMRHTKKLIRNSLDHDMLHQSKEELKAFGQCVANDHFVEGVKAFLEKRSPNFNNEL